MPRRRTQREIRAIYARQGSRPRGRQPTRRRVSRVPVEDFGTKTAADEVSVSRFPKLPEISVEQLKKTAEVEVKQAAVQAVKERVTPTQILSWRQRHPLLTAFLGARAGRGATARAVATELVPRFRPGGAAVVEVPAARPLGRLARIWPSATAPVGLVDRYGFDPQQIERVPSGVASRWPWRRRGGM